nr:hypothetical protein [Tanacetum cinerariifolium]
MFDKVYKRVNTFVAMDSEVMEGSKKPQAEVTEGSSKRAGGEIEQLSTKRHRLEKVDDTAELKRCLDIVPKDDDDVTIEATPLSSKYPTIVDYKIYKEGKKSYFKIIRADENSQNYLTFRTMFKNFSREDLEVLRSIIRDVKYSFEDDEKYVAVKEDEYKDFDEYKRKCMLSISGNLSHDGRTKDAGNPVKKIILKLNLSDHRTLKDGGEGTCFQLSQRFITACSYPTIKYKDIMKAQDKGKANRTRMCFIEEKKCCETLSEENGRLKKELREARCSSKLDHHQQPPQLPPSFYIRYSSKTETRHQSDNIGKTGKDMKPVAAVNGSTMVQDQDNRNKKKCYCYIAIVGLFNASLRTQSMKNVRLSGINSMAHLAIPEGCTPDALNKMLVKYGAEA